MTDGKNPKDNEPGRSLDDDWEDGDSDRTVIQGIKDMTGALASRQASLIVITGTSVGKMFKVTEEPMCIGRGKDCEIPLNDEGISRQHARVEQDGHGNVAIVDLNSTNGTYFNGNRITRHLLRDGDKIQIGSTTIVKFSFQDSLEESFQKNQYDQAIRDGLTGIFNKRHFLAKLKEEFAYAIRHAEATSLILFDIDHFKKVNDTYGHQAGDMVLKQLAEVAARNLREEDVLARYGGEEFAIILRNQHEQRAYVAAERIRRAVETHKFIWEEQRFPVTISLGIATLTEARFRDPAEMLREADEFLYESKRGGRNRTTSVLRRAQ